MNKKWLPHIFAVGAFAVFFVLVLACVTMTPEEQAIRNAEIAAAREGYEALSVSNRSQNLTITSIQVKGVTDPTYTRSYQVSLRPASNAILPGGTFEIGEDKAGKSPDDYVSVEDFYMVYGYACLYAALNKADINELTLTFVESRYPKKLLAHLQKVRGYSVEERQPGIYNIKGDILPIQIIDSRKLSSDENIWLKHLDNRLGVPEIQQITAEIYRQGKAARIKAYLDVIAKANVENLQEVYKMSRTALTLDKVLEEAGLVAKAEARGEVKGEAKKAVEIARNMLKDGFTAEKTAELSGLDISKVRALT